MRASLRSLVLGLTAAASLTAALAPAPAARAHSVPQVQTTKYLAPETLAAILRRAALGQQVLVEGDIVSWIIQFTPVENDATVGVAGYVTDYLPPNVEVVGASIVIPDGNGGFREVAPNLPGLIRNGWGRNEERWLTPFNTAAYDPSGQCAAANETNKCDGSIAMSYADTGIFYSTDARTAVFASGAERVKQGTNGYKINPTGAGQINPTFGQTQATTHNLWDADQTNAFGSIQSAINALSAPKSAAASVTVTAKGPMPFNAGSAVAGPDSGYKLDNTGNVGPWRRVAYAGSRVGNTDEGPATSATKSRFGQSGNLVVGGPTDGGFALSTDSPLPVATNAVRFAVGRLQVGELRYVKISVRLLADAPATGIVSNSEVFGGDAASEAGETGWDLTWRYHVPSVADNNTNLYVLEEVVAVDGQPFTGTIVPSGHTVTYRISYYNTGNVPQHDVVLKTELPTQMTGTATFRHALGTSVLPASPASAGPGATVTFATIPVLNSGGGGAVLVDLVPSAASGTMVLNRATLESTEIPDPVYSNAPIIIGTRAFLVATETVTPASAKPGDTVHYTITVKNTGFSSATGLAITNWLPTANATTGNQQRFRFQTGTSVVTGLANVTPTVTAPTTVAPFDGVNRDQLRWAFNASTALASGATATITFDAKVGTSVARRAAPYLADLKVDYDDGANDTYAPAYNVAPVSVGASLSGTLFEDTGWTGGPGRSRGVAGGAAVGIPAARVELYDGAGAFVAATYSDGAGAYRFDGLSAPSYTVRVVTASVGDADSPPAAGVAPGASAVPVEIFESDGTASRGDQVGGDVPRLPDAPANTTSATLASLTTASAAPHATVTVAVPDGGQEGVDLGFSYVAVVNTRPSGQGSLDQFIRNANAISGPNAAVFMIPSATDPLGRAADPGFASGVATITAGTALATITDAGTVIDGASQTANVGDTNPGELGAGGVVGVPAAALAKVAAPEIAIVGDGAVDAGLRVAASDCAVKHVAVHGFGGPVGTGADVLVDAAGAGFVVEGCVIGATAAGFAAPAALSRGNGVRASGAAGGAVRASLVGPVRGAAVSFVGASGWTVTGVEVRGAVKDGVIAAGSADLHVANTLVATVGGAGVRTDEFSAGLQVSGVTITESGRSTSQPADGVRLSGDDAQVTGSVVTGSHGAGVAVTASAERATIRLNSLHDNGVAANLDGAPATGQLGIDLRAAADGVAGAAPFVTKNDAADADAGGNGLLNFPVLREATLAGGTLTLSGWAPAGATLDVYVADADPSGFGEGATFVLTRVEGAGDDGDATTSAYSGLVNGLDQGADTAPRFTFAVAVPAGVAVGTKLTATATVGGATSEFSGRVTVAPTCGPCPSERPICDLATLACVACQDTAVGAADNGCAGASPVCDATLAASACVLCEDDKAGALTDFGCAASAPLCDVGAGGARRCVQCLQDADCPSSRCDLATNTCELCGDTASAATDAGCGGATPVCDEGASPNGCVPCEDSASGSALDFGCAASAPICNIAAGGARACVQCNSNADCGGGACDVGTHTCAPCLDTASGGVDAGCSAAAPVCDVTGASHVCVACEDSAAGGGADFGCPASAPLCEPGADGAPRCLACRDDQVGAATDAGCGAGLPLCVTDAAGEPTCVQCVVDGDCGTGRCEAGLCGAVRAWDDEATTPEDVPVLIAVLANDRGPAGVVLRDPRVVRAPRHGEAHALTDGTVLYTPAPGYSGVDDFTYEVCVAGTCDEAVVSVAVTPVADAPVAADDVASTPKDTPVVVDVLANDGDGDGDPLAIGELGVPTAGAAEIVDGRARYTPPAGFEGVATFTYTACDPGGLCDEATVTVRVGEANVAPVAVDDAAAMDEDGPPVVIAVLDNDSDPDGDALVVGSVGPPAHGVATIDPSGGVAYAPARDFFGRDAFVYAACDPGGACATALVIVDVAPVDDAPVAVDDRVTTQVGVPVAVAVLDNDGDPDGDALVVASVGAPQDGEAAVAQGALDVVYTPPAGFVGEVAFGYTACDPGGLCADATVVVFVLDGDNGAPVAADDRYVVPADAASPLDVLANDSDPDGDAIVIADVQQPPSGDVTVAAGGGLLFTPRAGFVGEETFVYTVCDDKAACDTATVTLVPVPVDGNAPPAPGDDVVVTDEDTPVLIDVLGNDADPDGDALIGPVITDAPWHGRLEENADATVLFVPDADFDGEDAFVYEVCDAAGACAEAVVRVIVVPAGDPPVAADDRTATARNQPVTVRVLVNDVDPDGDALVVGAVGGPRRGTAERVDDQTVSYRPSPAFAGEDSFTYEACDPGGACAEALVIVTVGDGEGPPLAADDAIAVEEGADPVAVDVLANDSDPDGDALTVDGAGPARHGRVVIGADGRPTYAPAAGFAGEDRFPYTACDGRGGCASAVVVVTVGGVNDAPWAIDDVVVAAPGATVVVAALDNDVDPDGDPLVVGAVGAPEAGTAGAVTGGGIQVQVPADFAGRLRFGYEACDPGGACAEASVTVLVAAGGNAPPVAEDDVYRRVDDTPSELPIGDNDSDPDGDPTYVLAVRQPKEARVALTGGGALRFEPVAGTVGEVRFVYTRCDLRGACDDAVVTVTIGPEDPDTPDDPSNPDGPDRTTVLIQGGACDGGGAGGGWAWLAALALGGLAITRRRRA